MTQDEKERHLQAAELIAREFVKQREKRFKKTITITIDEHFSKPYEEEWRSYEVIEKGDKIYIVHPNLPIRKRLVELINEEFEKENRERVFLSDPALWKKSHNQCNSCQYELFYEQYPEDTFRSIDQVLYVRDCMSQKGYQYFKEHCDITISKSPVKPVKNCPHWNGNKGYIKKVEGSKE